MIRTTNVFRLSLSLIVSALMAMALGQTSADRSSPHKLAIRTAAPSDVSVPKIPKDVMPQLANEKLVSRPVTSKEKASYADRMRLDDLAFVENKGQWESQARFLARTPNLSVWMTDKGWILDARKPNIQPSDKVIGHVFGIDFLGSNQHPLLLPNNQKGSIRDFMGPMTKGKVAGVRSYGEVLAKDVYPGVDVSSYIDKGHARFDFIVKPGADPSPAKLHFTSVPVSIDKTGNLVAKTAVTDVVLGDLKAYQYDHGTRQTVPVAFKQIDKDTFGFEVGAYDKTKELTIDPIAYGTYYGGDDGWDEVHAVVTDLTGGVYITGLTRARQFPRIQGPYGFALLGSQSAFMTKLQGDVYSHDYAAYFGGQQTQSGDYLQIDPQGNIWVAGRTDSTDFPGGRKANVFFIDDLSLTTPAFGTYNLIYRDVHGPSGAWTFQFNDSAATIKAAIDATLGSNCLVTPIAGGLPGGSMRIELPNNFPGVFTVDDSNGQTGGFDNFEVEDLWPNGDGGDTTGAPTWRLFATAAATGGTFELQFTLHEPNGPAVVLTTSPLPYNATAAQVQAEIASTIQTATGSSQFFPTVSAPSGALPGVGTIYVLSLYFNDDESPDGPSWADGLTVVASTLTGGGVYTTQALQSAAAGLAEATPLGQPFVGAINGTVVITIDGNNSAPLDINSTLAQFQTAVAGIPNQVGSKVTLTEMIPGAAFKGQILANWNDATMGHNFSVFPTTAINLPYHYAGRKPQTPFFMRWLHTADGLLNPEPGNEKCIVLDGDSDVTLQGFGIVPVLDNSGRVVMGFGGQTSASVGDPIGAGTNMIPNYNGESSYIGRLSFDPAAAAPGIGWDSNMSRYIGDLSRALVRGVAVDAVGNQYVAGTVFSGGTTDTSLDPVFVTTNGVFAGDSPLVTNGRLLRRTDIFVRKYGPDGSMIYSGLIGGDGNDVAGGWDLRSLMKEVFPGLGATSSLTMRTYQRVEEPTGSAIAIDKNGNAYVLGIAGSFDFPRTRGVFGEVFTDAAVATVTKVSSDGSHILYSTHLRTSNAAYPAGIAVDLAGNSFVTGNVHEWETNFPHPQPVPVVPFASASGYGVSTVFVTADAAQGAKTASPSDLPTADGWLNVLNSTGTNVNYGTYIGGQLDEEVHQPFVDSFGDCWVMGFTDGRRMWDRTGMVPHTGVPTTVDDFGPSPSVPLPQVFITPLAFKPIPDTFGDTVTNDWIPYGILDVVGGAIEPLAIKLVDYRRDGFVVRFRLSAPVINSVTFDSPTLAGGLGSSTTGHVNLSGAAPAGGMNITVSLSSTVAASFNSGGPLGQIVVSIPQGGTTGSFAIFTSPVTQLTNVDVKAEFLEDFKVGRLVVAPWLRQFSIAPSQVIGGNPVSGTLRLFQTATQDIQVTMLSDNAAAMPAQTVTVPQGQGSVNFSIPTTGVSVSTLANLTASFLGAGFTQPLTINPCNLLSLTFSPSRVSGGTSAIGTVKLDGIPGVKFDVQLSLPPGLPAGYTLSPTTLTFDPTDTSEPDPTARKFTLTTNFETSNVVRTVTASRIGQTPYVDETITGSINVDAEGLSGTGLTINPSTVNGGDNTAVAQLSLTSPADTGGTTVQMSTTDPTVTLRGSDGVFAQSVSVSIPAGSSTLAVPIHTTVVPGDITVTISANLLGGPTLTGTLLVKGVVVGITLAPSTVIGGNQTTATLAISAPAPVGGLSVDITATGPGSGAVHFTTPILLVAGTQSTTFTISTDRVNANTTATISAQVGSGQATSAVLSINAVGLVGLTFQPPRVRGTPSSYTTGILTFNGVPPPDGTVFIVGNTNPRVASPPATVPLTSITSTIQPFKVTVHRVSRTLATIITAQYNGQQVSAILTATR